MCYKVSQAPAKAALGQFPKFPCFKDSPSWKFLNGSPIGRVAALFLPLTILQRIEPVGKLTGRGERCLRIFENDPLFEYHRWRANLRILEIDEIRSIPHTPISHPFIERLIGTIRHEYPDHTLFWNAIDLERKLTDFQSHYNHHRTHSSLGGDTPAEVAAFMSKSPIKLNNFNRKTHCRGLYQLPIAA